MTSIMVGIADCRVSDDPTQELVTHALGSCIAVMIHDPHEKVGGMLHFMLPSSSIDAERAEEHPFIFADTGIPLLFQMAYRLGAAKARLVVMAAGGAQMLDDGGTFNIGRRNHAAMREIFFRRGVVVDREEIGGRYSRTVSLEIGTGLVWMRTAAGSKVCLGNRTNRGESSYGIHSASRGQ